jgi:muramidase (phage lysozyme)
MANRSEFYREALQDPRVKALLDTISFAEGTSGPEGYRTMFTGKLFDTTRGWLHPDKVNTGGGYSSTAAGRYQMLTPTYKMAARATGTTGFTPAEQDLQAVYLLDNRKALEPLLRGEDVGSVINMLAPEWASLPTRQGRSYYNQPVKDLSELKSYYGNRVVDAFKDGYSGKGDLISVGQPLASRMTGIVESRGGDTAVQNIGPFGDSSVGRGHSGSSKRKAGDALLEMGKGLPSRDSVKGTILEYLPVGLAALSLIK